MPPKPITPEVGAYFWARVDQSAGPGECWPWTLSRAGSYGQVTGRPFGFDGPIRAHRAAMIVTHGAIPEAAHVLHSCDNPLCCNPAHLRFGTNAENIADMKARRRTATGDKNGMRTHPEKRRFGPSPKGEASPVAKLADQDVCAIRRRCAAGEPMTDIAAAYGVSRSNIRWIALRRTWAHLP